MLVLGPDDFFWEGVHLGEENMRWKADELEVYVSVCLGA